MNVLQSYYVPGLPDPDEKEMRKLKCNTDFTLANLQKCRAAIRYNLVYRGQRSATTALQSNMHDGPIVGETRRRTFQSYRRKLCIVILASFKPVPKWNYAMIF